jgi:hypothetical protein
MAMKSPSSLEKNLIRAIKSVARARALSVTDKLNIIELYNKQQQLKLISINFI